MRQFDLRTEVTFLHLWTLVHQCGHWLVLLCYLGKDLGAWELCVTVRKQIKPQPVTLLEVNNRQLRRLAIRCQFDAA